MDKYFGGEELSREEIIRGLRLGVVAVDVAPVLCGAAIKNIGIDVLMDMVMNFMPSPADAQAPEAVNSKSNEKVKIPADVNAPFSAQVYKTIADPFVGKISMFKVMSGKLTADMEVLNSSKEKKEKLSSLFLLRGKKQVVADKLVAGDIAAVAKLQFTTTGDTLCDANNPVVFEPIQFPAPSISMAIEPKAKGDEDKIGSGLQRLVEEDPTLMALMATSDPNVYRFPSSINSTQYNSLMNSGKLLTNVIYQISKDSTETTVTTSDGKTFTNAINAYHEFIISYITYNSNTIIRLFLFNFRFANC